MKVMDVLIGGIPRSGTTALARAIELHPEIFCWSTETGIAPLIEQLTQGFPMRPENLPGAAKLINRNLRSAIIDQGNWRKKSGGREIAVDETEIEDFSSQLAMILTVREPRTELLRLCSIALRRFLENINSRRIIAEKSPSNALLLRDSAEAAKCWLMTHREPFSVLVSMQQKTEADPFSEILSGPIERRIGVYLTHARNVLIAQATPDITMTVALHELRTDPCGTMAKACMLLGVEPTLSYLNDVRSIIGGVVQLDTWSQFCPLDRWKAIKLCCVEMQALGYDDFYYRLPLSELTRHVPIFIDGHIEPLYGFYEDTLVGGFWVKRNASLAVYSPKGFDSVCINVYSNIRVIKLAASHLDAAPTGLRVTAFNRTIDGKLTYMDTLSLDEDCAGEWRLSLSNHEALGAHGNWRLHNIELETNFAFTPCLSLPDSQDERTFSFAVSGFRLAP